MRRSIKWSLREARQCQNAISIRDNIPPLDDKLDKRAVTPGFRASSGTVRRHSGIGIRWVFCFWSIHLIVPHQLNSPTVGFLSLFERRRLRESEKRSDSVRGVARRFDTGVQISDNATGIFYWAMGISKAFTRVSRIKCLPVSERGLGRTYWRKPCGTWPLDNEGISSSSKENERAQINLNERHGHRQGYGWNDATEELKRELDDTIWQLPLLGFAWRMGSRVGWTVCFCWIRWTFDTSPLTYISEASKENNTEMLKAWP